MAYSIDVSFQYHDTRADVCKRSRQTSPLMWILYCRGLTLDVSGVPQASFNCTYLFLLLWKLHKSNYIEASQSLCKKWWVCLLCLNFWPPINFFHGSKKRKLLGAKSGLLGGWWSTFQHSFWRTLIIIGHSNACCTTSGIIEDIWPSKKCSTIWTCCIMREENYPWTLQTAINKFQNFMAQYCPATKLPATLSSWLTIKTSEC